MSDPAQQIIARGPRAEAEAAAADLERDPILESLTFSIIEEDEARAVWRIDAFPTTREETDALTAFLATRPSLAVTVERLADADWLALALSGLPPVRAGRFFVFGAHDRGRAPRQTINLRIEAGAAFGTGHHGTTVGCLLALDRLLKARRFRNVLDVGTGTGVLALAAARTGAHRTVGTDIDAISVRIARENAKINRVRRPACAFVRADGLSARVVRDTGPYDLVLANILAAPLVRLAPDIRGATRPGGAVVLSGLLRGQARRVLAAYRAQGFALTRRLHRDAWATLTLRRRG
ncbi:MAG: 50S ribosomal protein L11 methyltransferase [Alphaproteobacteria bacterium]|nr:50S ribosomal protein L11 methyltransferase [Alphaproteobacteria bacterium]